MDDISKLVRDQNRVMTAMGLIFAIWQGSTLAREITLSAAPEFGDTAILYADRVEAVGAVLWVLATIALLLVMRRVKRARAQDVMRDELFRHNQSMAMKVGFKAMIALIVVLVGFEAFFELTSGIAIRAMMLVAVLAPLTTFVILSRDDSAVEA